jgi:exosortase A-associated hydrolase 2
MQPFFIPAVKGQRFCIFHPAASDTAHRGHVVLVHALAEELNRCRRIASLQARALSVAGFDVLLMDFYGCGDSAGNFGDASWQDWLDDVELARTWMQGRSRGPAWLWGVRAGALLAAQSIGRSALPVDGLLCWQPVVSGQQYLRQQLRLKLAGHMLQASTGVADGGTDAMLRDLEAGKALEVAGYEFAQAMTSGLSRATLEIAKPVASVICLELPSESPALTVQLAKWRDQGCKVSAAAVPGQAFWQLPEAELPLALVEATTLAMLQGAAP